MFDLISDWVFLIWLVAFVFGYYFVTEELLGD